MITAGGGAGADCGGLKVTRCPCKGHGVSRGSAPEERARIPSAVKRLVFECDARTFRHPGFGIRSYRAHHAKRCVAVGPQHRPEGRFDKSCVETPMGEKPACWSEACDV